MQLMRTKNSSLSTTYAGWSPAYCCQHWHEGLRAGVRLVELHHFQSGVKFVSDENFMLLITQRAGKGVAIRYLRPGQKAEV